MNVLGSTKVLGVFGHPIAHSLSPVMHNAAIRRLNIDYVYVPFHVLPADLEAAVQGIRSLEIAGVNVTIPHKEPVIDYLDEVGEYAKRIGSVNTVINENGRLRGESTDGPGFVRSAETEWNKLDGCRVVILGAGGSARAVSFALADRGCSLVVANRTRKRAEELELFLRAACGRSVAKIVGFEREELAQELRAADLVVNTTSVGMHPDSDASPVPPDLLHPGLLVYDLVYNPLSTRLITEARSRGAKAMSGLSMLVYQGALSLEMWTGLPAPVDDMYDAARAFFDSRAHEQ